ncbi:MAG: DUF1178 family protein [Betaproteobacteria bacterium]|nr:DUF1178 family protein [Betaproteobacteria bacterium]
MIIFDLSCSDNHRFEGWFRSADDFGGQLERGLVSCPQCGSADIRRLPSVLHLGSVAPSPVVTDRKEAAQATVPTAPQLSALRAVVEEIASKAEDVGNQFADEARKIHYHEAPSRPIRGLATEDDCSALKDEGIDILHLPIVKPEDLN